MERLSEQLSEMARIKPQTVTAAATATSDAVDMSKCDRVLFILQLGDYAAGNDGVVNASITGDTASGGSFATTITGKSISPANFSGSALDDQDAMIEVTAEEVAAQGLRYVRLEATPTNQNLTLSAVGLAGKLEYGPGGEYDLAKVKEIVT